MTNVIRQELAPAGIDVTALHVGYMDTDMASHVDSADKSDPAWVASLALDGIQARALEVLADDTSRNVGSALSGGLDLLYHDSRLPGSPPTGVGMCYSGTRLVDMSDVSCAQEEMCSIARTIEVVGDKWTILILREAVLRKATRFADFRDGLRIAPDILSNRLNVLLDAGVMEKQPYREPGARTRYSYHLTPAGEKLLVVLAALQQWGDETRPPSLGPTVLRRSADGARPVRVAFVDDTDTVVSAESVMFTASAAPLRRALPSVALTPG